MTTPPPRAERLLRWSLSPLERAAILGDLQEEHAALAQTKGTTAADQWYWRQVVRSVAPNLWRRLQADPRRQTLFRFGLLMLSIALVSAIAGFLQGHTWSPSSDSWIFYAALGAGQMAVGLFHRRLDSTPRQRRRALWALCLAIAALGAAAYFEWAPQTVLTLLSVFVGLVLMVWPRGAETLRDEVRVSPKDDARVGRPAWSLELPTEPLGLSGLVLQRQWATTSPSTARLPQTTIARTFAPDARVRVRAAVNLSGQGERASVELLDGQGKQVWQAPAPIVTGTLVEFPVSLDDLADRDPEDHFGLIDEAIPLATLVPGSYRIRVTVTNDTFRSSHSDEVITIAPSQKP